MLDIRPRSEIVGYRIISKLSKIGILLSTGSPNNLHICNIGVDLYTFVGARAPTMLSWAPPKVLWAPTTKVGTGITVTVLRRARRGDYAHAGKRPKCDHHSIGIVA